MSHDEELYAAVRQASDRFDPVPDGLADRMVAVLHEVQDPALESVGLDDAGLDDTDLDFELMVLVERSDQLAGTRGDSRAYTLRFGGGGDVDLLVRVAIADDEGLARLDGWLVPATSGPVEVREVGGDERSFAGSADAQGRFEFPDLPAGFYRLWLQLDEDRTFGTPAFEI